MPTCFAFQEPDWSDWYPSIQDMGQPQKPFRRPAHPTSASREDLGLRGQLSDLKYALDQAAIVAATDVQGTITFANAKFCEISQYSRDELIGANHRIINSGHHPEEFFREMYRTIASGQVWRQDIRNRAKDGSIYWVDTTIVPFLDDSGKPYQYVSIRYDITDRKRSEETIREQTGLVEVGKLASVVAHEVRNPLAGIRGAMQVLGRRLPADTREQQIIREVIARVDTLNAVVQDLLSFAHPRPLRLGTTSVEHLLREMRPLLEDDPKFSGVRMAVDLADPRPLIADGEQLKLVLMNLLLNAAQAMPDGGTVRVESSAREAYHVLRVIDEGNGVPPAIRTRLFEPFFTTKSRGTGLGLATARRIVDRHHGEIAIECPASGGTVVTIHLPFRPAVDD
jgi:two-component system CheB/CheR fusion protein